MDFQVLLLFVLETKLSYYDRRRLPRVSGFFSCGGTVKFSKLNITLSSSTRVSTCRTRHAKISDCSRVWGKKVPGLFSLLPRFHTEWVFRGAEIVEPGKESSGDRTFLRQKGHFGRFDIFIEIPFLAPLIDHTSHLMQHTEILSHPENDLAKKILPRSQLHSNRSFLYTPRERLDTSRVLLYSNTLSCIWTLWFSPRSICFTAILLPWVDDLWFWLAGYVLYYKYETVMINMTRYRPCRVCRSHRCMTPD